MTLRTLRTGDLPQLLRFERSYMQTVEPDSLAAWTAAIDRNLQFWIDCLPTSVASTDQDGAVTGMALWQLQPLLATLVSIHVVPDRQRQGLGAKLLRAFLAAAETGGMKRAALGVHEANPGAERLYLQHGFLPVGQDGSYRLYEKHLQEGGSRHGPVDRTAR
ncbi:MAG: GNAT family N-acetyltransferase [Nakamurella sp.]